MHPCPLIHQPINGTAPIRPDRAEMTESIVTLYPTHLGTHRSGNGFVIEHVGDWLQIDETTSSSRLKRVGKSSRYRSQAFGQWPHSTADIVKRIFV